ncbi:MAG: hypothetical protein KDK50_04200 [Chlamydiia bacterium]|nr:hypothetical protein [Chlamydiia bacterium]
MSSGLAQPWTPRSIAQKLYRDPTVYESINDSIVDKVNRVSQYLKNIGYRLQGALNDGNCFFHAFSMSNQALEAGYTIKKLREELASCFEGSTAEDIGNERRYVTVDEGHKLAQKLGIPMRVVSVESQDGQTGIADFLYPAANESPMQWDSKPESELPELYTFIVDLGGHFVSACEEPVTIPREFYEDAYEAYTFRSGPFTLKPEYFQNGGLAIPLTVLMGNRTKSDKHRMSMEMCKQIASVPGVLIKAKKNSGLSSYDTQCINTFALNKVVESFQSEICELERQIKQAHQNGSAADDLQEKLAELNLKMKSFAEHAHASRAKERKLNLEWEKQLNGYYKLCSLINALKAAPNGVWWDGVFKQYNLLTKLNPTKIDPHLPFLTTLSRFIELDSLVDLFKEAKSCDRYLAYATTVWYLSANLKMREKGGFSFGPSLLYFPEHVLKALCEAYPDDLIAKAMLQSVRNNQKIFTRRWEEIDASLTEAFCSLLNLDIQPCLAELAKSKQYLVGANNIDRYLAFAFALKGNPKRANEFVKRSKTLAKLYRDGRWTNSSETMYKLDRMLQQIGPKDSPKIESSECKEEDDPFIRAFIDLVSADAENEHVHLKIFLDQAFENLKNSHDDLHLIYFAMRWIISKIPSNPYNDERFSNDFIKNLGNLGSLSAKIAYSFREVDPWLLERFENVELEEGLCRINVKFGGIDFVRVRDVQTEHPFIDFNGLKLTSKSIQSVSTELTKQVWHLIISFLKVSVLRKAVAEQPNFNFLPTSAAIFKTLLLAGIPYSQKMRGTSEPRFMLMEKYLKAYKEKNPYPVHQDAIALAEFGIFSAKPTECNVSIQQIERTEIEVLLAQMKPLLSQIKINCLQERLELCARDAILVQKRFSSRYANKSIDIPSDSKGVYQTIEVFQSKWGWQEGEPFEAWKERLDNQMSSGVLALQHYQLNRQFQLSEQSPDEEGVVSFGVATRKNFQLCKDLLVFWRKFIDYTTGKNQVIAEGGDDDNLSGDNFPNQTHVSFNEWQKVILLNKPQSFPGYSQLTEKMK